MVCIYARIGTRNIFKINETNERLQTNSYRLAAQPVAAPKAPHDPWLTGPLPLSLSYCWAEAQQHQVTAGPVVQTTGGTPAACQYLSRGMQLALRDALDLILTRYLAGHAAGHSPADRSQPPPPPPPSSPPPPPRAHACMHAWLGMCSVVGT